MSSVSYELWIFRWNPISIKIRKLPDSEAKEVEDKYESKLEVYIQKRESSDAKQNETISKLEQKL